MSTFHHTVHFWLRHDLSDDQRQAFFAGLKRVADSPNVELCRVGVPAGTDRPVVDNSYDAQLHCVFASQEKHDAYQSADDEVHTAFIEGFKDCWAKVVIYDSVEA
ncbi:MAG: Dabb family protein [Planctomycetota bacterium]